MISNLYGGILNVFTGLAFIVFLMILLIFVTYYILLKEQGTKLSKNEIRKRDIIRAAFGLIFIINDKKRDK